MGCPERGFFDARLCQMAADRPAGSLLHVAASSGRDVADTQTSSFYRHVSDCHEFSFVTAGKARVATPGQVIDLIPGQLLVIERGVEHEELPTDPRSNYTMFWCGVGNTLARLDQTTYSPPSTYRAGPTLELDGRTDVESIAAAISSEIRRRDWNWRDSTHGLLTYLTSLLIRRLRRGRGVPLRVTESPAICADPRTWRVIRDALQFCDANFRHSVRLEDVAASVGYSPSHLSHLVSKHLGHSLSEHLHELRMNAAKHLLEQSDRAVSDIARSVGYPDPSNFSHAFTRSTGVSPSAYRQQRHGL